MWTILGQPSTGILVPYWPVGETPPEADGPETAPLNDVANQIKSELYKEPGREEITTSRGRPLFFNTLKLQDAEGEGIWKIMMPVEDSIVAESERRLEEWRSSGIDTDQMLETEKTMTAWALATLEKVYEYLINSR